MIIKLIRVSSTRCGTFGCFLREDGVPICNSVELPWRGNTANISCIPSGSFVCTPLQHKKFGKCFRVGKRDDHGNIEYSFDGRSGILIHAANVPSHLRGCIAPGNRFDPYKDEDGVLGSRDALDELIAVTHFEQFDFLIWEYC